jgi:hypothetical protein
VTVVQQVRWLGRRGDFCVPRPSLYSYIADGVPIYLPNYAIDYLIVRKTAKANEERLTPGANVKIESIRRDGDEQSYEAGSVDLAAGF